MCFVKGGAEVKAEKYINRLMADALWTHGVTASVRDDQRAAYATQLEVKCLQAI